MTDECVGLLGALDAEVSLVRSALSARTEASLLGVIVHRGILDGHRVILAQSGVGKVNAALATAALAESGASCVVFTGVAGGLAPGVGIGDIVVASDLVQHDVDVTGLGKPRGQLLGEPLSWPTDDRLRDRARLAAASTGATTHVGRIASGDQFIASKVRVAELHQQFGALAAEMEGAATAQVAAKLGLPCVVVRTISDTADDDANVDFPAFLAQAAPRGLAFVRALLASQGA